jgi:hypothetical protein
MSTDLGAIKDITGYVARELSVCIASETVIKASQAITIRH